CHLADVRATADPAHSVRCAPVPVFPGVVPVPAAAGRHHVEPARKARWPARPWRAPLARYHARLPPDAGPVQFLAGPGGLLPPGPEVRQSAPRRLPVQIPALPAARRNAVAVPAIPAVAPAIAACAPAIACGSH